MSLHVLAYNLKRVISDPGYGQNDEGDEAGGGVSLFNGRCGSRSDSGA